MKLEWGKDKIGDYYIAMSDVADSKKDGWRLPSVQELQDAGSNKVIGFTDGKFYWSNDWHGDPTHAGAVQMYSGAYFIGMFLNNECNYRLVKEIN